MVGVKTDFKLEFLLRFDFTFCLGDLENSLFFYLGVVELPGDLVVVDVVNGDAHKLGVASLWLGDDFALEIDDRWLENKLGFDCLS